MINLLRNGIVNWLKRQKPLPETPMSDFQKLIREIQPCDVILVEGRSSVSEVIKLITQSSWSHAALYIGRMEEIEDPCVKEMIGKHYKGNPNLPLIIESELGLGTIVRSLKTYEFEHLRLCRPRNLAHTDAKHVLSYCAGKLGSAYNVRQVFDLARFLFPWFILPRRWRSSLFSTRPGKSTQTVCSTMIAEAFGSVQFPILPLVKRVQNNRLRLFMRNPKLCTPRDFDYSPYFDIIKYPFLDFVQYSEHRLQPWDGIIELSEEEKKMYVFSGSESEAEPEAPHSQ
ncbi:MAG: hypothetical protein ACJASY_000384 [Halioglobus sp.]|jgi:hypothetical protein